MSYPEPVYLGASGVVSATYRSAAQPADLTYPNGNTVHYLGTSASTDGRFGLYRWEMGPAPSGPGPHFHRSIAESFYILGGSVKIYDGRRWIDTRPGDFVHVPEGGIHGFRNESGEPASMLIHFAPGAPREGYFEGIGGVAGLDEAARLRFYLEHDNIWVDEQAR